jgi:hypothetical protein
VSHDVGCEAGQHEDGGKKDGASANDGVQCKLSNDLDSTSCSRSEPLAGSDVGYTRHR